MFKKGMEIRECQYCKHYEDCKDESAGIDPIKDDHTCEDWEEEVGLTKEEEDEIVGDREYHEKAERGEIE